MEILTSSKTILPFCRSAVLAFVMVLPLESHAQNGALLPPSPPQWPLLIDADQDGLADADEILLWLNPLDAADGLSDLDGDGLSLAWEWQIDTAPDRADTDADGWSDSDELLVHGTDPRDATSRPADAAQVQTSSASPQSSVLMNVASTTATATAPPSLMNGDFTNASAPRWYDATKSTSYQGSGFKWGEGTASGWTAYRGSSIEIWQTNGQSFVELDGNKGSYGIKQPIKDVRACSLLLAWKQSGRNNPLARSDAYYVQIYYQNTSGAVQVISKTPVYQGFSKTAWTDNAHVFTIKEQDIQAAAGAPIYVAFIPEDLNTYGTLIDEVKLFPVGGAPEVLAVNSDFDEGRIDPATGYAMPDCDDMPGVDQKTGSGNTKLELDAERDHLDGTFTQGQHVVDDLHKGWFGVNPNSLGDDFWAGANVTIRKIDKIDGDTGYKESGQIRFYAKWDGGYCGIATYDFQTLQPVNLVSAGVNLRPNEGVYGASSTIPDGVEFYMEGVRPGKITLEWRLQKGTIDVKHEQTFKVVTQKTRDEWRDEVRYQVRLQSSVAGEEIDLNNFNPTDEFTSNTKFLKATYGWYQQNFVQSKDKLIWAGMAKMAGAPVYAALSDAQVGRALGPGIGVELTARQLQRALMKGNKDIFLDLAWQHRAYAASGILALIFVDNNDESVGLRAVQLTDWILIDKGFWQNSLFKSSLGARELLRREQRFIIESVYSEIVALELDEIISVLAKNPIPNLPPLGKSFAEVVQVGNLAVFDDRWRWIKSDMYPGWTGIDELSMDLGVELGGGSGGYSESDRLNYSQIGLSSRARNYATFPNSVP